MQTKKDEIYNLILITSRKEFLDKGFVKTSMRSIAKACNLNLSNIYNYFKSKDKIFKEVLNPILLSINNYLTYMKPENYPDVFNCDLDKHIIIIEQLAKYIFDNKDMLNLLIFKANGSSLENFKDYVIDEYTKCCLDYSKLISVHETGKEFIVSEFVAHNIAGTWANFITEVLMHKLSKEETIKYGKEMMIFMFNGWRNLMKSQV